jgi:hypothetical protein
MRISCCSMHQHVYSSAHVPQTRSLVVRGLGRGEREKARELSTRWSWPIRMPCTGLRNSRRRAHYLHRPFYLRRSTSTGTSTSMSTSRRALQHVTSRAQHLFGLTARRRRRMEGPTCTHEHHSNPEHPSIPGRRARRPSPLAPSMLSLVPTPPRLASRTRTPGRRRRRRAVYAGMSANP